MPSPSRAELRRLQLVNSLFASLTGNDLYLAQQIKEAIRFRLADLAEEAAKGDARDALAYDQAFNAAAADLLARLFRDRPRHGFYHWDASLGVAASTPLFTRAEIIQGLRHLAGFRESTLLITNLRAALIPPGRRTTPRRQRDYEDSLAFIRELAATRVARSSSLHLLLL
ncbi:MAG: hypothetical protein FJ382_10495 [Verrucomicrobia bacterium]|nr:hypothetical protein [Verrucomicrobiota bacterium]